MNQPELISIIVPVYKVEKYLDKCVESIVEQTYKNLEIILVDDGSPDNCSAMCDEWAQKDSRIKVIHKENGGLSSARNAGLDACTGDYIGFVDSDDWIEPDMYEYLLNIGMKTMRMFRDASSLLKPKIPISLSILKTIRNSECCPATSLLLNWSTVATTRA